MDMKLISIVSGAAMLALTASASAGPASQIQTAPGANRDQYQYSPNARYDALYRGDMYTGRSIGYTRNKVGGTSHRA